MIKMNYFSIGLGIVVAVLAIAAYDKVIKLEKKLKEKGILEEYWEKTRK